MIHSHITAWVLAIVLFLVALGLHRNGKQKGAKIVHMIIRTLYVLILISGVLLVFSYSAFSSLVILKALAGFWVIATLEMILIKTSKRKNTTGVWLQFSIAFILVLYMGLSLPNGFNFF